MIGETSGRVLERKLKARLLRQHRGTEGGSHAAAILTPGTGRDEEGAWRTDRNGLAVVGENSQAGHQSPLRQHPLHPDTMQEKDSLIHLHHCPQTQPPRRRPTGEQKFAFRNVSESSSVEKLMFKTSC
jgi:hypothetical protein